MGASGCKGARRKLTYDGLKEVDGRSLHQVTYVPKKAASELNVRLYFEPDTFRHVMTQYKTEVAPYMNVSSGRVDRQATTTNSAKTTYTITESFDDFQTVDGITLPRKWQLDYKVEPVRPIQMHWVVDWGSVRMNPSLDLKAVFPEM